MRTKGAALQVLFSFGLLTMVVLLMHGGSALAQSATATQTVEPTPTPTPTPTRPVTYSELLAVQKQVLENAQSAIKSVESTTKPVLWLVGIAATVLTAVGLFQQWRMVRAGRDIVSIRGRLTSAEDRIRALAGDVAWYERLMLSDQVRTSAHRLCCIERDEWEDAATSLEAQLKHEEPAAQTDIVRAIEMWAESDPRSEPDLNARLRGILESLLQTKPERVVQVHARLALAALQNRPDSQVSVAEMGQVQ